MILHNRLSSWHETAREIITALTQNANDTVPIKVLRLLQLHMRLYSTTEPASDDTFSRFDHSQRCRAVFFPSWYERCDHLVLQTLRSVERIGEDSPRPRRRLT